MRLISPGPYYLKGLWSYCGLKLLDMKTSQEHVLNLAGVLHGHPPPRRQGASTLLSTRSRIWTYSDLLVIFSKWIWKLNKSMYWILLYCCMVIPHQGGRGHQPRRQLEARVRNQTFYLWVERSESILLYLMSIFSKCPRTITRHPVPSETLQCSDWILELQNCMYWILLECCMVIPQRGGRGHQPRHQPEAGARYRVRVLVPSLTWGSCPLPPYWGMIFLWSFCDLQWLDLKT